IDSDTPDQTEPASGVEEPVVDVELSVSSDVDRFVRSNVEEFVPSNNDEPVLSEVGGPEIELPMREEPVSGEVGPPPLLAFTPETVDDGLPPEPEDAVDDVEMVTRGRRRVPAPTPVAIETVVPPPDLTLVDERSDFIAWEADPVVSAE